MIPSLLSALWKRKGLLFLSLALIVMAAASIRFIQQEIAPFYPLYLDQNGYLSAAYAYADTAQRDGFFQAIRAHLTHDNLRLGFLPSLNTNMALAASWMFLLFGEGRLGALSIHLLSFAGLLATVYFVIARITRRPGYALAAVAFILFLRMPHIAAGGLADFRMDFPAACWMGISIALWVLFLHQPKSKYAWLATGAMAILLFFRIIALVYLALPLVILALFVAGSFWNGKRLALRRCFLPLLVFGLYAALLLGWDWAFVRSYYFGAQLGSEVADRGADKTWAHLGQALSYYPKSLAEYHFGWKPLYLLGTAIAFSAFLFFWKKNPVPKKIVLPIRPSAVIFCLCAVAFPLVILTSNPHRTPQVAGISTIPLALTGLLLFLAFSPRRPGRSLFASGAILLSAGTFFWISSLFASAPFTQTARQDALNLNPIFEQIFTQLTRDPTKTRTFAVYDFQEGLIGYGVRFYGKEHLHSNRSVQCIFPVQIQKIDAAPLLEQIRKADLVVFPRDPEILTKRPYPISKSMFEFYPRVKADLLQHKTLQSSFTYQEVLYDIFVSQ